MIKTLKKESIKILDYEFNLQGIISDYESLILTRNFFECGTFELHINALKKNTDKLNTNNWLLIGNYVEKCLIIETVERQYVGGKTTIIVKGTDLKGLMKRRITYTDNFDRVSSTQAENVMKHYVTNHFIDSRLVEDSTVLLPERNMPILECATTQNRGVETVWQSRFENVHDVLKHIADDTGLGWTIYANLNTKKFVFDVVETVDRTTEQFDNPQIIFTKGKMNIKEDKYYLDKAGKKNVAYVGGKGENEERVIVVKGNAEGIERREVFIDLNNIIDLDELNAEGEIKLSEYKEIETIEAKVYSITNMEYGVDWFLGDKVTLEVEDIKQHKVITSVKEIYERNNIITEVTFGDKKPNLVDELKKSERVVE